MLMLTATALLTARRPVASPRKEFVGTVANAWYYWFDELAAVDSANYPDAQSYLDVVGRSRRMAAAAIRLFISQQKQPMRRFTSGAYYGFGFRYSIVNLYFADTSKARRPIAGLRRGQQLLAIDLGEGFET